MSGDPYAGPAPEGPGGPGGPGAPEQPTEEELRAAYEAELSRITSTDMMAQAAVSLLNIAARRLGPAQGAPDAAEAPADRGATAERDLEQVRDAIDAVRALLEILERRIPSELRALRDALSQIQLAYAREVQGQGPAQGAGTPAPGAPADPAGSASGHEAPAGAAPEPGRDGSSAQKDEDGSEGRGPAESSGRLWVPGR